MQRHWMPTHRIVFILVLTVIGLILHGCDEQPRQVDVAPTPVVISSSISATPNRDGTSIDISVTAHVLGISKADALRRVAADMTRLATDLEQPPAPQPVPVTPTAEITTEKKGVK